MALLMVIKRGMDLQATAVTGGIVVSAESKRSYSLA